VKQGCQLSPVLFNLNVNDIEEEMLTIGRHAPNINRVDIPILLYADILVLLSQSKVGLQRMLQALRRYYNRRKLEMNVEKRKITVFKRKGGL